MRIYLDEEKLHYDIFELVRTFVPMEEISFTGEDKVKLCIEYKKRRTALYKEDKITELFVPYIEEDKLQRRAFKKSCAEPIRRLLWKEISLGDLNWNTPCKNSPGTDGSKEGKGRDTRISKKDYSLSQEKAVLLYNIAERQRPYLYPIKKEDSYSLYINIPFCPTRCDYCSFPTILYKKKDYQKRLYKDPPSWKWRRWGKVLQNKRLETVYIGGGTPTSLDQEDLRILLTAVKNILKVLLNGQ